MIYSLKNLKGSDLLATDDAFGSCRDAYFHDHSREVVYLVADLDRWTRGRKLLISPEAVEAIEEGHLRLNLNREAIEGSPSVEDDQPVSRQVEERMYTHYGWTPYWKRSGMNEEEMPVPPIGPEANDQDLVTEREYTGNPHLRSLNEVLDYRALAFGDNVGSIVDLLIDDVNWRIEYIVVDTKPWQNGGRRIVPASYIQSIDFHGHSVNLTLPPSEVEHCADGDQLPTPMDEEARSAVDRINGLARQ